MKIWENIVSALGNVYSHKMRSMLTMLGIIIGIGSVIMITAVGTGVKNSVFDTINSLNKSAIQVYAQTVTSWEDYLRFDDAAAIQELPNVAFVTSISEWWNMEVKLRIPTEVEKGSILGTDQNYSELENFTIDKGRFITANDVENRSYVAVIKPSIAFKVFGKIDCIGEKIEIENWYGTSEFTVIGIMKEDADNAISSMINTPLSRAMAIVPVSTINDMFYYEDVVDFMAVSVIDGSKSVETSQDITKLLNMRHGTTNSYGAQSMEAEFDAIDGVLSAITGFVAFVAAISLFVGGVGVMNIMLVTVKERTREIGIRKSLGASNRNIRSQFVMEAIILCLIGGLIGIFLGGMGAKGIGSILTTLMGTTVLPTVDKSVIMIAFGVSTLVGILFGTYPAGKAAKLDPIEALRYE